MISEGSLKIELEATDGTRALLEEIIDGGLFQTQTQWWGGFSAHAVRVPDSQACWRWGSADAINPNSGPLEFQPGSPAPYESFTAQGWTLQSKAEGRTGVKIGLFCKVARDEQGGNY